MSEQPTYFQCGDVALAGVLTISPRPNGTTVLVPWGAGAYPSSGRNRLRTRLAHALAEEGFHSFRFDYSGVGESGGEYRAAELSDPYTAEVVAAVAWLQEQGLAERLIIVANCFGAWSTLMALEELPPLAGAAFVNTPVRRDHHQVGAARASWGWWIKHIRDLEWSNLRSSQHRARYRKMVASKASTLVPQTSSEKGSRFSRAVTRLLNAGTPVLLLYGEDGFRPDFDIEFQKVLGSEFERAGSPSRVVTVTERVEGFATLSAQDELINQVTGWLTELVKTKPKASA